MGRTIKGYGYAEGEYVLNAPDETLTGITASADAGILHVSKDASVIAGYVMTIVFGLAFSGATVEDGKFILDLVRTTGDDPTGGTGLTILKKRTSDATSVIDFAVAKNTGLTGGTFGASLGTVNLPAVQGAQQQCPLYMKEHELLLAANEGLALVMRTNGDAGLNGWFRMEWVES